MFDWLIRNADTIQQYAIAFVIPVLLIFLSAFVEKIVKKEGWKCKYFYLGVDLTLAAMSAALVNLADAELPGNKALPAGAGHRSSLFLAGSLFLLFILMNFQQDYGLTEPPTRRQKLIMIVASNLLATGVFFGFILMKLRGLL